MLRTCFLEVKKLAGYGKSVMEVWITGHRGFLRKGIGLFVDGSNKAEPYFCFEQQIAIFRVEALS